MTLTNSTDENAHTGGCLCGGVRYRVRGALRHVTACHCNQCRRTSGHHAAMTSASTEDLSLIRSETLAWYPLLRQRRAWVLPRLRQQFILAAARREADLDHGRHARSAHGPQARGAYLRRRSERLLLDRRRAAPQARLGVAGLQGVYFHRSFK